MKKKTHTGYIITRVTFFNNDKKNKIIQSNFYCSFFFSLFKYFILINYFRDITKKKTPQKPVFF